MADDESDSDERVESGDGDEDDVIEEGADAPPEIPFDAEKSELVLDFRAVSSLPYDYDSDGIKSLRAIMFGKGKGIHVPREPGKIIVCGEWKLLNVLMKVHFVPSTRREPELLLSFVDYGFASASMQGISVETLALPLLVKKGVYQDSKILTGIKDVAGFTTINTAQAPWSITMKPALQKQDFFSKFKIFNPAAIHKWLATQKMVQRIDVMAKRARVDMDEAVKEIRRQDPSQATKTKARFDARLNAVLAAITALPPSAYDVRMQARILQLLEDRDQERDPCWMTSPIARDLRDGTSNFVRTRLLAPAAPIPEPVEPIRPIRLDAEAEEPPEGAGAAAPEFRGGDDLELSDDDSAGSGLEDLRSPSKRTRTAPARLEPETAHGGKKPRDTAAKSKATVDPKAAAKNYKRGPYKAKAKTAANVMEKAQKAAMKKELKEADTKLEIASLKLQLKAAMDGKKAAEEQVKDSARLVELEICKARAEGVNEGLKTSAEEYKKGVAAGAAIAMGKPFRFAEESPLPSSATGSSASAPPYYRAI